MKFFGRTLSMILSFQLLWSCNQQYLVDSLQGKSTDEKFIELKGSIAKTFHHLSNFIIPSAVAQDGEMIIYDMTDPNDPVEIYAEEIYGKSYSIKIEKEKILNRPIKLSYESYDDDSKSRQLLIESVPQIKTLNSDLNEEGTLKSRLAENVIKIELDEAPAAKELVQSRITEIKKESLDKVLNVIGEKEVVYKLLVSRKKIAEKVSYYAAVYHKGLEKNNADEIKDAQDIIRQIAMDEGLLKKEYSYKNYVDEIKTESYKDFDTFKKVLTEAISKTMEEMKMLMTKDGIKEGSDEWIAILTEAKNKYDLRLKEGEQYFSGKTENKYLLQVKFLDEVDFFKVKDYNDGRVQLESAYNKSYEQLNKLMENDKLTEKDIMWQETIKALDKSYMLRISSLDTFFGMNNQKSQQKSI